MQFFSDLECGGDIQRAQGHIALESYPTNARCEWRVQVKQGASIELRWVVQSFNILLSQLTKEIRVFNEKEIQAK